MRTSLLRLWLLRRVLSLPPAVLRFFSGGGVIYRGDGTLDPQLQFLWRTWFAPGSTTARMPLVLTGKSVDTAREEWRDMAGFLAAPSRLKVRLEPIGDADNAAAVSGILLRPPRIAQDAPLLVFFHQGGGVLGGPELSRAFCTVFAAAARCPVFIPTLRLAPEARFPAALDDARLALEWATNNAQRLGAAQGAVAVGGVLTGAGLAARLCLDLRRECNPLPVAQLLVTPLIDLSDSTPASSSYAGLWPLSAEDVALMISYYAGAGVALTDPRLSPAREAVLTGLPKTLVVSGGLDPLAAQAETFARSLLNAGVETVYRRYDTLPLGFDLFSGVAETARAATADMAREWMELLRTERPAAETLRQDVA